jgi:hypothetical protein
MPMQTTATGVVAILVEKIAQVWAWSKVAKYQSAMDG